MRRSVFFLVAALLPYCAQAKDHKYEEYMPTVEEVYEDCRSAIASADEGDLTAFYKSRCGASTIQMSTALLLVSYVTPTLPQNPSEQEKHDLDIKMETVKALQSRFCGLIGNDFNHNIDIPEVYMAKRFINSVDAARNKDPKKFIPYFQKRTPFAMASVYSYNCKYEQKP
jgi:hypothetical protein